MKQNSIENLLKTASALANQLNDNEKLAVPLLAVRAKKAAYNTPEDQSVRIVYTVLNKMAENNKLFITKGEFKEVCNKFASARNSSLTEVFAHELDIQIDNRPQRKLAGEESIQSAGLYDMADPVLANALSSLWDDNGKASQKAEAKMYDPRLGKQASFVVSAELGRLGLQAKSIGIFGGNKNVIVCDATFETPKGQSHLLVPVEITASGAMLPNMFANKYGFSELTTANVNSHIIETAGKSFTVNAAQLLDVINITKEASVFSETQLQMLAIQEQINHNKISKQASVSTNQKIMLTATDAIVMQELDKNLPTDTMLAMPQHEDTESFAQKLSSAKGIAEFSFGKQIVENGRDAIVSKVASLGYKSQASVASCDSNNITYAVKISTANGPLGFEVLADVKNNRVVMPSIVAVKDRVYDFDKNGLNSLIRVQATNYQMVAAVSPMYELKSSEILSNITKAANTGDYETAEDALTVLAEKDNDAYQKAFAEYMRSLNVATNGGINKSAATCGCNKIIKLASHSSPICGHLNMPLDKVYQNEKGECCPSYRKGMSDTYEGMTFSTARVLLS